jgi:phosphopantothenoylcysteine synthetase/decarboxylase
MSHGLDKLRRSGADLLVLNTPVKRDSGFGKDSVEFTILKKELEQEQQEPLSLGAKTALASRLVQFVSAKLGLA